MTNNLPPEVVSPRDMSLLELTIAIAVLLALISITFTGSRAWKRGSDRASCILTLRNMQLAARSYQNLYGYNHGERPRAEHGSRDIARHLYDKGYIGKRLFERASGAHRCPSGGGYSRPFPAVFPEPGELYMKCSLSASDAHQPNSTANW